MFIDWPNVKRVLIVKLRSIGDTVLVTPSLIALKRFLPHTQIDILLEDWVAPLLDGFDVVDNVLTIGKTTSERIRAALAIRRNAYDVVFNMHGGTTATFLCYTSGARHRVGFANYQYKFLYNHLLSSASDYWQQETTHSAEQQLALLGFVGVPVDDRPKSRLTVTESALQSLKRKLTAETQRRGEEGFLFQSAAVPEKSAIHDPQSAIALFHPAAAFATKQWSTENFARTAEFLAEKGLHIVAIAAKHEAAVLEKLVSGSRVPITTFDDLSLPEITALASKAKLFVGNDSGIAHIAAAVGTPSVVIFGSSNRNHWRPWTDAPNEIVFEEFACQPCPGYKCEVFGEPKCIVSVKPDTVFAAIDQVF